MSYASVPSGINEMLEIMYNNGIAAYLVGGCVRDFVMNRIPNDFDITVGSIPEKIEELFGNLGYKTVPKGHKFGTVEVFIGEDSAEITPHRTEGTYSDSRHPDKVEFVKDLKLDLVRRDFTINAMAMDKDGNITDIFGGLDDIKSKTIRCIGEPKIRFTEDALRILRAMRFASRLGFTIEPATMAAMSHAKSGISEISGERIASELRGILIHPHSFYILSECIDIIRYIIPGFEPNNFLLSESGDFITRLFSCINSFDYDEICKLCQYLKLTGSESKKMQAMHILYNKILTRNDTRVVFDDKAKAAFCDYDSEYIKDVFIFSDSDTDNLFNFAQQGIYTASKLSVSGGEIASCGIIPKNETSKVLKKILYDVAIGKVQNTKESIFAFLFEIAEKDYE